ncbi:MAG TPA: ABC transporter substrate-binding protein, partial [Candidatus Aveggerthella excrementigallinarum]|nr:ABC transporter substrate-binding protein [Candidatus Aveggerthella excrementigallinarum]
MKKKLLAIIGVACVLCLSAVLLAGCGGASTESASEESAATEETASTAASTEATDDSADITDFIVGFDQSYPPYGFVGDDGEYTGFD